MRARKTKTNLLITAAQAKQLLNAATEFFHRNWLSSRANFRVRAALRSTH